MTGVLQGCLLVMGITFEIRERRRKARERDLGVDGHGDGEMNDERTALLGNER